MQATNRQHERTKARQYAAMALYSAAIRNKSCRALIRDNELDVMKHPMSPYAKTLALGVEMHEEELNRMLSGISVNWSLDRMPIMDITILRIALFEMIYVSDVPISVSINEAVELAKRYGGEEDSPKFINGMLGAAATRLDAAISSVADIDQSASQI